MLFSKVVSWVCVLLFSFLLAGCSNLNSNNSNVMQESIIDVAPKKETAEESTGGEKVDENELVVVQQVGTDTLINKYPKAITRTDGGKLSVNFNDAPLMEIINIVLGDLLNVPYTIEGVAAGNITLVTDQPVEREVLFDLLEALLEAQGIAIAKSDGGIYRVAPVAGLKSQQELQTSGATQRGYSVKLASLNYISVLDAMKILESLGVGEAVIHQDPVRNILILGASAPKMANILRTLEVFDVDVMAGMSFGIYEVFNLDVVELNTQLEAMFVTPELSPIAGMVKFVPLKEINSLMVISAKKHYLDQAREWIDKLDNASTAEGGAGEQMYVYKVENGDAIELANLLSQLFNDGASEQAMPSTLGSVPPGSESQQVGSDKRKQPGGRNTKKNRGAAASASLDALSTKTQIVPDEVNNSLLVMATPANWRSIKNALRKLDLVPLQVLVEVSIWEVTLNDSLKYGVEWYFEHSYNGGDVTGLGTLDTNGGGVGSVFPGFSYLLTGNDWSAVVSALDKNTRVEVLSSPSVLVLDNQTATINVGNQVPVSEGSSVTDGGTTIDRITYKDTGVILTVSPRVNTGGLVIMDIDQQVTDVGTIDVATGQRSFLQRQIQSSVAIQSGDSIVLGGLIQNNRTTGDSGIPFLHSLPVIGPLFGQKSEDENRTELLVTISPKAISQYEDFELIAEDFRKSMKNVMSVFEKPQAQK